MRGGLDDALEKLARRNELRRRTAPPPAPTAPPAVTELVEAVTAVVARHPELTVTMAVEGVGAPLGIRVLVYDGVVHVNAETLATAGAGGDTPAPSSAPAAAPPPPPPPPPPPADHEQTVVVPVGDLRRYAADGPVAGAGPITAPQYGSAGPGHGAEPPVGERATIPIRRPPEPLVIPSSEQAAKRLAALLREDPSLLDATQPE